MREPAQSYNHKIKVLLPEPNSAKHQQLADRLSFFSSSSLAPSRSSPAPGVINLSCILCFENETENINEARIEHFHICFPPRSICVRVRLAVWFLVMRGYGTWRQPNNTPPPSPHHAESDVPKQKKKVFICFCTIYIFAKSSLFRLHDGVRRFILLSNKRLLGCGFCQ